MEIPTYPGYYISEDGDVMNSEGKILKQNKAKDGYWRINIGNNTPRIHRLLALAYIPNPTNLPMVDHIDRNRENNSLFNLRWASVKQNGENRGTTKNSKTGEKNIFYMKDWIGKYRYAAKKVETINGKEKRIYEKWFDTLEEAIFFRNSQ